MTSSPPPPLPPNDPGAIASDIGSASLPHAGEAVVMQAYALNAANQPHVDLSKDANLAKYQDPINKSLDDAKEGAKEYLDSALPDMITTISNIDDYFTLQNTLPQVLVPGTSAADAMVLLDAVRDTSLGYANQAAAITTRMTGLRDRFSHTAADMTQWSQALSTAVSGDNGELASLQNQLSGIDAKIKTQDKLIGGGVGLIIAGGITVVVAAFSEVVTGGAATAVGIVGCAIIASGVGMIAGAGTAITNLNKMKSSLLNEEVQIKAETALASQYVSSLTSLETQAADAATAAQNMANAWTTLNTGLGGLISDLDKGHTTVDVLRQMFTLAAENQVKSVQDDVLIIKKQLAGVQTVVDPGASLIDQLAQHTAAA
ncbi:HBL/NHE enterotoxin family protein [Streptomyces sp. NPDC090303]|uniref:HBL/NHE enterotoxin family protein n=1 Tax=Streptomyces sp. NPDC090303 TaxID=3365960 RepID=UPI0038142447